MKTHPKTLIPLCVAMLSILGSILACAPFSTAATPIPTATFPPPPINTPRPSATSEPPPRATATTELPPQFFTEDFNGDINNWHYEITNGDENYFSQTIENSRLVMKLEEENLYVYNFYDPYTYEDVRLDIQAVNMGRNSNNINIICRYSSTGWYEFTVQNDGLYSIWAYDEIGGSGYNMLWSGGSTDINTGQAANDIAIICAGNRLSLYINGNETKTITDSQYFLPEGQVGFGLNVSYTNAVVPVIVGFESVTISQP
jgi:hypothetical protein